MRAIVSQEKCDPIKSSRTGKCDHSKTDSHDTERIREKSLPVEFIDEVGKTQQHNDTATSSDLFANDERNDSDLLQKFFAEMDVKRPNWETSGYVGPVLDDPKNDTLDAGLFQIPNAVRQPEMDFNGITGFDIHENSGPNEVEKQSNSQTKQQRLLILELQVQLHNLTMIFQQKRQKSLKEQERTQAAQESVVDEVRSTPWLSHNAEAKTVSINNSSARCVPNQSNSYGPETESRQPLMQQCNQKRMITRSRNKIVFDAAPNPQFKKVSPLSRQTNRRYESEDSLRKKKQVRSNNSVKRSNFVVEKDLRVRDQSKTNSCSQCGKQYSRKDHLIRHLISHTGEKPYKCVGCAVAFSRKDFLIQHQMIHSGAKPFECRICNVAFNQRSALSRHLLIHTNEKPFLCDICQKSFRRKDNLSSHMNIHSGRESHKCNVCKKTFRQRSALCSNRKVHSKEGK